MEHIYKLIIEETLNVLMKEEGELELAGYRWILQQCRQNRHVDVEVIDVGYDVSSYPIRTCQPIDSSKFKSVEDFLDSYTGNTIATYNSGSGFAAETFEEIFRDFIRGYIYDWIAKLPLAVNVCIGGDWDDEFIDYLCDSEASECCFVEKFSEKTIP